MPLMGISLFFAIAPAQSQTSLTRAQQVQAHKQKAQEYLATNKPDLAIPEFKAIVTLEPNNIDARGNLGVLYFFRGAFAEAIPQLRAALKLQPTLWKIQALLGTAELRTGDTQDGLSDLEKSFPNLTEKKIQIDTGLQLIDIYSAAGRLDRAAAIASTLREIDPTNAELAYSTYRLYSDLTDESRLTLSVLAPKSARMHQMMAHELSRQGKTAEALENYSLALKIDPNLPGLRFEYAELINSSKAAGGPDVAEKEYLAALKANPNDAKSECRLGDIAAQRNDLPKAQEYYARALKLQPDDPEANIGMAKVLMSSNQPEKAEALLKHAIQVDPTIAVAHFRLSTLYRQTGRPEEAKQELGEYQNYKDMKEKLREMYRAMQLEPGKLTPDETDVQN
ncbi:MAG TPA: tetratricopeptide repeat protein [Candidatus Saccharimonadales bacterium]|nr:tetratricopeptide repeat protein [Candidatus Saccharimonadales bacterium]